MTEIHQILVTAAKGDAVFQAALEIQRVLRGITESEIYARNRAPHLAPEIKALPSYLERPSARSGKNVLIYHVVSGEPAVTTFLMERPEPLVLVYHNIAPAEYFDQWDAGLAGSLRLGRQELLALRDRTALALADSPYNARELTSMGFDNVRISPLILDFDDLHAQPAPGVPPTATPPPTLLFVGQLLPHKRPDLLLQMFHVLTTFLIPEAGLVLVGSARVPGYVSALKTFVSQLALRRVLFAGSVTVAQLAAHYRRADVFATMSEHEGFCVPLLEAMSFDLPVVARGWTAIPETVEDGGLLLPPEADPILAAEAIADLLEQEDLRRTMIARGRRRLASFDGDAARATLLANLSGVM
jgi:glycosyltransferase involved in cell wall biosynthesis